LPVTTSTEELREWVNVCHKIAVLGISVYAYANNHFAGHARATVRLFQELWKGRESSRGGTDGGRLN